MFYFFTLKEWVIDPCLMYKKKFLLTFFGYVLTILAWTTCRLVTKLVLSITHFHSCFFLLFRLDFIYSKNLSCPQRIICYLFISLCVQCETEISFRLTTSLTFIYNALYTAKETISLEPGETKFCNVILKQC